MLGSPKRWLGVAFCSAFGLWSAWQQHYGDAALAAICAVSVLVFPGSEGKPTRVRRLAVLGITAGLALLFIVRSFE
jgi:hypothetical protein